MKEIYCWDDINSKTRFVGLVGPVDRQTAITARALNAAFRKIDDRHRCLPLPIQSFDRLGERLERLKIIAVLVAPELARAAAEHADKREGSAESSGCADLLHPSARRLDRVSETLAACGKGARGSFGAKG